LKSRRFWPLAFPSTWRKQLRSLHRDFGYSVVGFTLIYAISGLAVNHLADWDPNFTQVERSYQLPMPQSSIGEETKRQRAEQLMKTIGRSDEIREVLRIDDFTFDLGLRDTTLHVDLKRGIAQEEGQSARPLLRLANWLHLNRGKKAWTFLADAYAVLLIFLALSGLFLVRQERAFWNRRTLLVAIGFGTPVLYVVLSGGPGST